MNTLTELAVNAFRNQEQARRRLAKAEAVTAAAVARLRGLPAEFDTYVAETEAIRLAIDAQDEEEARRHRADLVPLRHPGR
jgi:hypothetical protein